MLVNRDENFSPGIGLRHPPRRFDAPLFQHGRRLRAANDGSNVGERGQKAVAWDATFDLRDEVPRAHARHQHDNVDLAANQLISEIDDVRIGR